MPLQHKKIAVYITGGIAVYKAADFVRQLIKSGARVRVAMTESATKFVTPLTFQVLTKETVHLDTFHENNPHVVQHIELADWCDLAIVVPATANTIAKLAHGLADNFVTSALLATTKPKILMPAMNEHMLLNAVTQRNLRQLAHDGYDIVTPDEGFLAEGYHGKGRLPAPSDLLEHVVLSLNRHLTKQPLRHKKVLITAGGTKEKIDPVRFITNESSGKMGYALARRAAQLGAEVILISASRTLAAPYGVDVTYVESAAEMAEQVYQHFSSSDISIMAAAVSDYKPLHPAEHKLKKQADQQTISLELTKNPDILANLGEHKTDKQFVVGFAAETENVVPYAEAKLLSKKADLIIANDVSHKDSGFNSTNNAVTLIHKDGRRQFISLMPKNDLSEIIFQVIIDSMAKRRQQNNN